MATTTKVADVVRSVPAPRVEEFVQPSELCDTQRRSMAYDAFACLQSHGK